MRRTWACVVGGSLVASTLAAPPALAAVPVATKAEGLKPGVWIHSQADKASAKPGDKVTYTIQVKSTVERKLQKVRVTGHLGQVLDDATYNDDASGSPSYGAEKLKWKFALGAGKSKTFTYSVTVKSSGRTDDSLRTNVTLKVPKAGKAKGCETVVSVKEKSKPPPLPPSPPPLPPPPSRSDDLEVEKKADRKGVKRGDKVTYRVTIRNPAGSKKDLDVDFVDNLTDVLDDATYNDDVKVSRGDAPTYENPELRWTGKLSPGESVDLTYSVTVKRTGHDNKKLVNEVIVPGSNCAQNAVDPKCTTEVRLIWLKIDKNADPDQDEQPGDKVAYTLTITNVGTYDFTEVDPVIIDDDMADVLDDADFNDDASPASPLKGTHLLWETALGVGDSKTFTYSVTVKVDRSGNGVLDNKVLYEIKGNARRARTESGAGCSVFRSVVGVD